MLDAGERAKMHFLRAMADAQALQPEHPDSSFIREQMKRTGLKATALAVAAGLAPSTLNRKLDGTNQNRLGIPSREKIMAVPDARAEGIGAEIVPFLPGKHQAWVDVDLHRLRLVLATAIRFAQLRRVIHPGIKPNVLADQILRLYEKSADKPDLQDIETESAEIIELQIRSFGDR